MRVSTNHLHLKKRGARRSDKEKRLTGGSMISSFQENPALGHIQEMNSRLIVSAKRKRNENNDIWIPGLVYLYFYPTECIFIHVFIVAKHV